MRAFFVPLILPEGIFFKKIVFYLNVQCNKYTFRIYILVHIKKHYFIHFCCLFLKSLKAVSASLIYVSIDYSQQPFLVLQTIKGPVKYIFPTAAVLAFIDFIKSFIDFLATSQNRNKAVEVFVAIMELKADCIR